MAEKQDDHSEKWRKQIAERVRRSGVLGKRDRYTERARRVLQFAYEEAIALNHNYLGTEHFLMALVREGDGVAAKVLANLGVELEAVRSAVVTIIGRGDRQVSGEICLTSRAKRALEFAVDEAKRMNHHYIGTEHQLLGLLREGEGVAAGVLKEFGVDLERVRVETTRILSQSAARPQELKRYSLILPEGMLHEVQDLADQQHTTVVEIVRRFIRLGLLATRIQETPGAALIIREGDREREILLL